jgi:hypothetical protein
MGAKRNQDGLTQAGADDEFAKPTHTTSFGVTSFSRAAAKPAVTAESLLHEADICVIKTQKRGENGSTVAPY